MHISTFFTFLRFFGSLTVLPFFLLFDWFKNPLPNQFLGLLAFVLLSFTDFLDGYYARKHNNVSHFGAFLDPVADKCLMITTMICLLARGYIHVAFVLVMIMRELFMVSLRQYGAEKGVIIPVSSSGKLKTFFQSIALSTAILFPEIFMWNIIKNSLLAIASYFSLVSLFKYGKTNWKKLV